jgi:transcriptional regulator with XRE-family HTH domain
VVTAVPNRLREARLRLGLTQDKAAAELAKLAGRDLGVDANAVSRHERGMFKPRELLQHLYSRLYGVSVSELWPVTPNGGRPDSTTADHLAALVHSLRVADDTEPTGTLIDASAHLLTLSEQLTDRARLRDRPDIGRVAAEAATLHWWLLADAGQNASGAHDRAMSLAVEWGITPLVSHLLGWRAGLALSQGDLTTAVRLARRARLPQWGTSPGGIAWATAYEARAQMMKGSPDASRALDIARAAYDRVDPHAEPPWLYWLSGTVLRLDKADMQLLAEGPAAVPVVEAALTDLSPERVRDAAWYRAHIAAARARAGDLERAAQDAAEAARLSAATGTTWTLSELSYLARRQPELSRLREALADHSAN